MHLICCGIPEIFVILSLKAKMYLFSIRLYSSDLIHNKVKAWTTKLGVFQDPSDQNKLFAFLPFCRENPFKEVGTNQIWNLIWWNSPKCPGRIETNRYFLFEHLTKFAQMNCVHIGAHNREILIWMNAQITRQRQI